jgi:hypothetical protein
LCTGNGYITTTVLREILKELDDKLTAEDLDLMIEEIDSDGSGTVDFDGKLHDGRKRIEGYHFDSHTTRQKLMGYIFSTEKYFS